MIASTLVALLTAATCTPRVSRFTLLIFYIAILANLFSISGQCLRSQGSQGRRVDPSLG